MPSISLVNTEPQKRSRRIATTVMRLQVMNGDAYATINIVTDQFVSLPTVRRHLHEQKYRWEHQRYFGDALLRIVEEPYRSHADEPFSAVAAEAFALNRSA